MLADGEKSYFCQEDSRFQGDTIVFKSNGANYYKERDGHKCNTVRRFEDWHELKDFEAFRDEYNFNKPNKHIKIWFDTEGYFTRLITDITKWEGYWIISWKDIAKGP